MAAPCPILLINLGRSPERLRSAGRELAAAGLAFERIEAVDGRELAADFIQRVAPWDRSAFFKPLSPGEVGCYLSHVAAAERIVREGWPKAVVLEDDFRLRPEFAATLRALVDGQADFDLVKLEGCLGGGQVLAELASGNRLVRHRRPPVRTVALLWSRRGAEKFLAASRMLRRPVDVQLKHWWEGDLDILAVRPPPVVQDMDHAAASTIGARRARGWTGRLRQWRYRLRYAFESQWRLLRRRGCLAWIRANLG